MTVDNLKKGPEPNALARKDFLKILQVMAIGGGAAACLGQIPARADCSAATNDKAAEKEDNTMQDKLAVVWTSGDRDVALKMVFMYVFNAKKNGWWKDITLVIWGPSTKLLSYDTELQDYIGRMKEVGVVLRACKACADSYGVSESLEKLGITVEYMGTPLTEMLKGGGRVVTF
jgi:hypothetical protein